MYLKELYNFLVREGIRTDLRTKKQIQEYLKSRRQEFSKVRPALKKFFDKESLVNPYADTRILFGDPKKKIRKMMIGIDIDVSEMILADHLRRRGQEIDLVLAHHPEGIALAGLDEVMAYQVDVMANLGVDQKIAKHFLDERIQKVGRGLHGINHTRTEDAAKLLDIPLLCCHTPADNHVGHHLQSLMDKVKPSSLNKVIDLLLKEPEYQDAMRHKAGPKILVGKGDDKAGKIFVDMTGGSEGTENLYGRLSQLGVTTYLGMHLSENHFQKLKSEHMNVIIAGHMASDNLGMNLLLDKVEKNGKFAIIECSGFRRVRR